MGSFFEISETLFELTTLLENNIGFGFNMRGGGVICADQHAF